MLLGRLVGQNWDRVSRAADRARETGCVRDEGCHRVRQGQGIERGREIGGYVQPPPEPQRYPAGESQNDGSGPHPRDSQGGGALPEGHRIAAHPTNDLRPCPAMGRTSRAGSAGRAPPAATAPGGEGRPNGPTRTLPPVCAHNETAMHARVESRTGRSHALLAAGALEGGTTTHAGNSVTCLQRVSPTRPALGLEGRCAQGVNR